MSYSYVRLKYLFMQAVDKENFLPRIIYTKDNLDHNLIDSVFAHIILNHSAISLVFYKKNEELIPANIYTASFIHWVVLFFNNKIKISVFDEEKRVYDYLFYEWIDPARKQLIENYNIMISIIPNPLVD